MIFQDINAGPGATQIIHVGDINAGPGATQNIQVGDEGLQPSFCKTSNYESYKNFNPERVPETCVWFLEHPTFQAWKNRSGNDLLWLTADPGCGKSVLSRALVDEKLVSAEPVTLCHFFFKDNQEQNNTATALCAILHQFFCAHDDLLHKHAAPAVKKCGGAMKLEFEELWRIFIAAATDPSAGSVVCVLDALDECQKSDRDKLITCLERFYNRLSKSSVPGSKLKFLVTSRPYSEIGRRFSSLTYDVPTIRLAGEGESEKISLEIGIVMKAKVEEIAKKRRLAEDVRSSLHRRLSRVPNRTYLWLHLTLDEVEEGLGKTQKKLLKTINTLPRTVEEAYEKILAKCVQEHAKTVLQIILVAQRPLTLSEIDVALAIEPESTCHEDLDLEGEQGRKEWLRDACGLFISVVDSRVYLIHQTAKEFLVRKNNESPQPQSWHHSIDLHDANLVLSMKCVAYLNFYEIQQITLQGYSRLGYDARKQAIKAYTITHEFLDYSAIYWTSHVRKIDTNSPAWVSVNIDSHSWVSKAAKLCEIRSPQSCVWFEIHTRSNVNTISSFFIRDISDSKESALYFATKSRLLNETQFLLDSGLASNEQNVYCYAKALEAAAANEDRGKDLMGLFLKRREDKFMITQKVVAAAADNRKSGEEIMVVLLQEAAERFEISAGLIVQIARWFDHGVMKLLLEQRGDEVRIIEEVVTAAARNLKDGRDVIALLLDRRGDEIKITEEVVEAAAGNWENGRDVIALLLDRRGDEIKITEKVVEAAAGNENNGRDVIALLLDRRGDEIKITEKVVEAAAGNEDNGRDVIALLLDRRGEEIKITEQALAAAAKNDGSGREVMELLLKQRGDEIKITEKVLKAAAENNGEGVMALLLKERGDEIRITEEVVKAAAGNVYQDVMALLLKERGDEVKITEEVLKVAVGYREAIGLLLQKLGDQLIITEEVLKEAARDAGVMALLLEQRGDEVKITEEVLKVAVTNQEVMELLLQQLGDQLKITEEVVMIAAGASQAVGSFFYPTSSDDFKVMREYQISENISLLFEHSPDTVRETLRTKATNFKEHSPNFFTVDVGACTICARRGRRDEIVA